MEKKKIGMIAAAAVLVVAAFFIGRSTAPKTAAPAVETLAESIAEANIETTAPAQTTAAQTTAAQTTAPAQAAAAKTTAASAETIAETTAAPAETTSGYGTAPSPEAYRQLFLQTDYGDTAVYVIGHKSPDTDTVTSAIAMAELLNQMGIAAMPRITAEPNKETQYFLKDCGVEIPEILEDAAGSVLWLVDHSDYTQTVNGAQEARIVGITDHHGIGSVSTTELIPASSGAYGSTASEVFWTYVNCGAEMTPQMARVMLSGVISDTNDLTSKNTTDLDREAYAQLLSLAGMTGEEAEALNTARKAAKYDRTGMTERDIFYVDYKDYEKDGITYGVANVSVYSADEVPDVAAAMAEFAKKEIAETDKDFLVYTVQDSTYAVQYIGYVGADAPFTETLMEEAFKDKAEKKDGHYVLSPSVSRKKFVPFIDAAIEKMLKN